MMWTTRPRSDFGQVSAIAEGDGPLVIMLHGVGLQAEAWCAQIDDLVSAGYRVVAPDMPGHGHSPLVPAHTLSQFATLLSGLLKEEAVIVGHSMGAMLALTLASMHPDKVAGIIALNAVYRRDEAAKVAVRGRAGELDGIQAQDPATTLHRWFGEAVTPEREACAAWLRHTHPAGYKTAYTVFAEADGELDTALARLRCPALFMTGEADPNSTPAMSEAMAAAAMKGEAQIIAGAAHMLPMTHASKINGTLLRFAEGCLS